MTLKFRTLRNIRFLALFALLPFWGEAQNFEVSSDTYDSIAVDNYFIRISGYAAFTDSMTLHVNLVSNDTVGTIVYSGYNDFSTSTGSLTNFAFDANTEVFSFDIGSYSTHNYVLHIWSEIMGELKEELFIHIDEL
ncbi:MAG: hypothetical protein MK066_14570 [Crocinitomicaceae bacterium]|nr:hypothetical protein [Crocinitomicaceae bacterium]